MVGDFNYWDGTGAPDALARVDAGSGSCSSRTSAPGTRYKFEILGRDGVWREKADPMAFATEVPPATGVGRVRPPHYEWGDDDWIAERAATDPHNAAR